MTQRLSDRWSAPLDAGCAGIRANLAALEAREEPRLRDFVKVSQIRWKMAALRLESAALRVLRQAALGSWLARSAIERAKKIIAEMKAEEKKAASD